MKKNNKIGKVPCEDFMANHAKHLDALLSQTKTYVAMFIRRASRSGINF